jgi:hypothetical protein
MGRVHEVQIGADAKAFDKGIRDGVIEPLQDAEKALEDLGKSSGPEQLERDLKDAQKETERLADDTKDTAREIDRAYKQAGQDIKKGVGDGLQEATGEAKQSGREAAASFSGEWDDVGDFIQETAANAFGGFGPLGAAAGIAAAAGIGVITNTILSQQEAADELKERLSAAYQAAAEEGRNYLDTAQIVAEASDLMFNKDRADEWKQVQADAKQLGLETYDVIAANAGQTDKQREVQAAINALVQQTKDQYNETDSIVGNVGQSVLGIENRWREVIAATEDEKTKARELQEIVAAAEADRRSQVNQTADAAERRLQSLQQSAKTPVPIPFTYDPASIDAAALGALQRFQNGVSQGVRVPVGLGRTWE